jgi:CDP-diacylglycerol--glycerol-3-phosphate 3-phosphatidyltransferase
MNTPTKITVTRIIAVVLMLISLFVLSVIPGFKTIEIANTGINLVYLIVFVLFVIACYTDHLDGYLARKNNQVTDLGKFLDPVADKLLINSLVIFLIAPSIFSPYIPESCGPVVGFNMWCAIILVARDIVVDALRFVAANKGVVIAANIFGKLKTVLEMIAVCFVLLNGWPFIYFDAEWPVRIADIFVYLATLASVISGAIYVIKYRNVFKEGK